MCLCLDSVQRWGGQTTVRDDGTVQPISLSVSSLSTYASPAFTFTQTTTPPRPARTPSQPPAVPQPTDLPTRGISEKRIPPRQPISASAFAICESTSTEQLSGGKVSK
jgi:hypothetical protein